ncbi:nitrile hydratase subunit beta [Epibacterium ulvae]|uniref:SH3-like domain-containing protein n=1 Tax=Epibacterium ulvae TaxID=1156985 RepID=UPI001BFC544D|nr:SH3-like domain-containing protein [Epibacterium ulvae]MBT8155755.1 nitrile hydratase subunit beta [Epibacterium ulvae]
MNSIHDLGGMEGFGPINPEENEATFHYEWEKPIFGWFFSLFAGGIINVDVFRHAIERLGNQHYLESSYYEHWLGAFETLLVEGGTITTEEIDAKMAELAGETQ